MTIQTMIITDKIDTLDKLKEFFSNLFEKNEWYSFNYSDALNPDEIDLNNSSKDRILIFEDNLSSDEIISLQKTDRITHIRLGAIAPINSAWGYEFTKQMILCSLFETYLASLSEERKTEICSKLSSECGARFYTNKEVITQLYTLSVDADEKDWIQKINVHTVSFRLYTLDGLMDLLDVHVQKGYIFLHTRTKNIDYRTDYLAGTDLYPAPARRGNVAQVDVIMADVGVDKKHYLISQDKGWVLSGIFTNFNKYQDKYGRTIRGYIAIGYEGRSSDSIRIFKEEFLEAQLDAVLTKYWDVENREEIDTIKEHPILFGDSDCIELKKDKLSSNGNIIKVNPFFGCNAAKILWDSPGMYCSGITSKSTIKKFDSYRKDRYVIYSKK